MKDFDPKQFMKNLQSQLPVDFKCSACSGKNFSVINEYVALYSNKSTERLTIGPHIPTGVLVCDKCGHIDLFALGALGLMNNEDTNDEKEQEAKEN